MQHEFPTQQFQRGKIPIRVANLQHLPRRGKTSLMSPHSAPDRFTENFGNASSILIRRHERIACSRLCHRPSLLTAIQFTSAIAHVVPITIKFCRVPSASSNIAEKSIPNPANRYGSGNRNCAAPRPEPPQRRQRNSHRPVDCQPRNCRKYRIPLKRPQSRKNKYQHAVHQNRNVRCPEFRMHNTEKRWKISSFRHRIRNARRMQ